MNPDSSSPRPVAEKIVSTKELLARFGRPREKKVVFTNGVFDILHRGHVEYLDFARRLGDALVVGLNTDESVRRLKGPTRPVNREEDRAVVLAALAAVDAVVLFGEDTPQRLIAALLPDVLVKGADYRAEDVVGATEVTAAGGRVVLAPLVPGRSTTSILQRARGGDALTDDGNG
jgi:rfaE bifunctional protein nucleotidyltransferase chain/domain